MGKLFRLIDYSVVDFLICDVEDAGHGNDHLHNCAPNSFHYCQFHCSGAGFSEQGSYSFICIKPLYDGQKVVLYSGKRSACNLGCKIPRLTLAESQQGEVKHHLAYAVSDGKRKGLETKDGLVLNMREDTTHKFETLPGLAEISIIDYQAGGAVLVVAADTYPGPQLKGKVVQQLAPVDSGILDETVEHVFSTANHAA